jgi:uncharacterized membrane protein HdeD (DUF308 family)
MILGLLLFFNTYDVIVAFSVIIGIFLILLGIAEIINYIKNRQFGQYSLVVGLFCLIAGILLVMNTNIIATIIPIVIGICMIGMGARKLELAISFKDNAISGWALMLIMSLLTLICGIILIINPIKGAFLAAKSLGIIIVIYAIIDIIDSIAVKENVKKLSKILEEK